MSYCKAILNMLEGERKALHQNYHDNHYGFPIHNDNELFGRLLMEVFQAGLSWETILKKEKGFRQAFADFDIYKVANFDEKDIHRLLSDVNIIRNRLKIQAVIYNAQQFVKLQNEFGSFEAWLDKHHPKSKEDWVKLFKKTFKFTGGEIVGEFLMSTGYLSGAHDEDCVIQQSIKHTQPKWMTKQT